MTAYLIVQVKVVDEDHWDDFGAAVGRLAGRFGGRYLVPAAHVQVLEGSHDGRTLAMSEFPSMDAISRFLNCSEFSELKDACKGFTQMDVWAVTGAKGGP
jgi:uncharacterized protein (DUF1330 family)